MENDESSPAAILVVDDDKDVQQAAGLLLRRRGFAVHAALSPEEAWSVLAAEHIDVVLLDLNFRRGATSGEEGMALLAALLAHDATITAVVVTGHSGINIAVAAMRAGAVDFVMKPWSNDRLVATLQDAVKLHRSRRQPPPEGAAPPDEQPGLGESPPMRRMLELLRRAAPTGAPVLLLGEAGTGKTLLAQTLHRLSPRAAAPLATIDPAAVWAEGEPAFSAALYTVDEAGTLVLDEVGNLPAPAQAKLGAFLAARPALRVIATTRQPRAALQAGALHPDLLYRLNTVELPLPPLRERGADLRLLAEHFLRLFARRYARPPMALPAETEAALAAHSWPGNVRELRQTIERAVVLAQHPGAALRPADIPLPAGAAAAQMPLAGENDLNLARSEKAVVEAALRRHSFNVSHAARELGVTRATLYRRMARHNL